MEMHALKRAATAILATAGLLVPALAAAQDHARPENTGDRTPANPPDELWETRLTPIDESELRQRYVAQQKTRSAMERELRKIRADYFRSIRNKQIRQAGIVKLREYTDPVIYPSLIEIFARDGDDVRGAILDHLIDQQNDDADTVVAWTAIFDKDKNYRALAAGRLQQRIAQAGGPTRRIKSVVAEGLRRTRDDEIASAAQLAQMLRLAEAIPMLINAQVSARGGGSSRRESSLAWILVGQQQAFVADLTPVVGNSAVAFDPQLAVVTSGTVLRVIDAVVVTYRVDVHNALVGLTSDLWGRPTAHLGYDGDAWAKWYRNEFLPYWKARQEADMAAQREADEQRRRQTPSSPAAPHEGDGDSGGG